MLPRSSWGTLLLDYKLVLGVGRPVFVRLMKWPFLAVVIAAIFQTVTIANISPEEPVLGPWVQVLSLMVQLVVGALFIPGVAGWLRWVIDPEGPVTFQWQRREWVFLGRSIQVYLIALMCGLVGAVLVGGTLALMTELPFSIITDSSPTATVMPASMVLVFFGVFLLAAIIMAMIVCCYGMSPVAGAVGGSSELSVSGGATRPARWHMFWTLVLYVPTSIATMVPFLVIGTSFGAVSMEAVSDPFAAAIWGGLIMTFLLVPIYFVQLGVFATAFALYYRWLVLHDFSDSGAMNMVRLKREFS